MNSPFPFDSLLVFGFLSILLLSGTLIRARSTLVQHYLFPSCLVGGIIGSFLVAAQLVRIESTQLETLAYHLFNLSFISIGLTRNPPSARAGAGKKTIFKGSLFMALTQGITFPVQALIGGLVVLVFGFFGTDLFATFGFLSPLGFNEGPGQALSFGKVWEGVGFTHAVTIGLTFAAVGFMFAFFIGVPLANWGLRRGLAAGSQKSLPKEFLQGLCPPDSRAESAGQLKLHSSNIDSLAFQTAVAGLVYLLTYFAVDGLGRAFGGDVAKMLWGFFFFFGLAVSILVRSVMDRLQFGYLLDPGLQKRITGWSVDYLIVATIPAIQLAVVWKYILPIALISIINGLLTLVVVIYLGRRLVSENLERIVAIFGTVTGTAACGLLLLRIVDPEFKTSAVIELALMNLLVLPILFPCLLLVNAPLWWNWSLGLTLLGFAGIAVISFVLMKAFKVTGPPKF
jgi:glutamate:Na+ symporter, ESS family